MPSPRERSDRAGRPSGGFTLLEVLVALAILAIASGIVAGTFWGVTRAWRRGQDLLEDLRHGDFVMEQISAALRSAAFFQTSPSAYGFWFQNGGSERDEISWVCSGSRFVGSDDILAEGLHRVLLRMDQDEYGAPALAVKVWSILAETEPDQVKPMVLSRYIEGLDCRIGEYNEDLEQWEWKDEWPDEKTNTLPHRVAITLSLKPLESGETPPRLARVIEIPLGPLSTSKKRVEQRPAREEQPPEKKDGPGGEPGVARRPVRTQQPAPTVRPTGP